MSNDDHDDEVTEHLVRGNAYLRRARLIGAGLTVFFVAHLEFILLHCVQKTLGVQDSFFAIAYPLLLGGFILSVLLRRSGGG